MLLERLNSHICSIKLRGNLLLLPGQLINLQLMVVNLLSLFLDEMFKVRCFILVKFNLLSQSTALDFQIIYLLLHKVLILLQLRAKSLQSFLRTLLIHIHLPVIIYLNLKLVPLFLNLFHSFMCKLNGKRYCTQQQLAWQDGKEHVSCLQ